MTQTTYLDTMIQYKHHLVVRVNYFWRITKELFLELSLYKSFMWTHTEQINSVTITYPRPVVEMFW